VASSNRSIWVTTGDTVGHHRQGASLFLALLRNRLA
jgi:hypothetical protein